MIEHDLEPGHSHRELMRHELAHALGALLSGAVLVRIHDDGISWRSDPEWSDEPDEFRSLVGQLAGPHLVRSHASANDLFVMAVVPADLRSRVLDFVDQAVRPSLEQVSVEELDRMAAKVASGETVLLRRTRGH